jgi:hypothetical protein
MVPAKRQKTGQGMRFEVSASHNGVFISMADVPHGRRSLVYSSIAILSLFCLRGTLKFREQVYFVGVVGVASYAYTRLHLPYQAHN